MSYLILSLEKSLVNKNLKFIYLSLIGVIGTLLVLFGLNNYQGSTSVYVLFSITFWLMLWTSFGKRTAYGYLFLAIMLWLGFWGKVTAHLILDYPYVEPVGLFDGSAGSWDNVLWVSTLASIGMMFGKLLFTFVSKMYSRITVTGQESVPSWYLGKRQWVWTISLTIIIGIHVINIVLGIQQIGLTPKTILPWPLNALIAWQVSIGSAMWIAVLLWWDISLKKNIAMPIYALVIEATAATLGLLSRGVYIFHTVPQFFALFQNRSRITGMSKKKVFALILTFTCLMVFTLSIITTLRTYLYSHSGTGFTFEEQKRLTRLEVLEGGISHVKSLIAQGESQEEHLKELLAEKAQLEQARSINGTKNEEAENNELDNIKSADQDRLSSDSLLENKNDVLNELDTESLARTLPLIVSLAVDRWIGLEGVMAVSAYPDKSSFLLLEAVKEKREIRKITQFQNISNSHYRWVDSNKWQFASLPGAAAFLYFSGSLWVVLLGMAMFSFLLQLGEQLIYVMTTNLLLCSLLGFTMANSIAQFGLTPRQDIPFYSMVFLFLILVYLLQSVKVNRLQFWKRP